MPSVDNMIERGLALAGLGLVFNIAFAVLVWLYALVFLQRSVVTIGLGAMFVVFGSLIVLGFFQTYGFSLPWLRDALTVTWDNPVQYRCENCRRSFRYPDSITAPECPYCSSSELRRE